MYENCYGCGLGDWSDTIETIGDAAEGIIDRLRRPAGSYGLPPYPGGSYPVTYPGGGYPDYYPEPMAQPVATNWLPWVIAGGAGLLLLTRGR